MHTMPRVLFNSELRASTLDYERRVAIRAFLIGGLFIIDLFDTLSLNLLACRNIRFAVRNVNYKILSKVPPRKPLRIICADDRVVVFDDPRENVASRSNFFGLTTFNSSKFLLEIGTRRVDFVSRSKGQRETGRVR